MIDDYAREITIAAGVPEIARVKAKPAHGYRENWSKECTARLISLHRGGGTAEEIASAMGANFTRNAILGKIMRLRDKGVIE